MAYLISSERELPSVDRRGDERVKEKIFICVNCLNMVLIPEIV